ncbi:hypothetical protein HDU93_010011 [Gonapodya sp. JEL0774]|nr:hypothetical protein HDU93_010011 [Gonapodya sp. JEL0774]
MQRQDEIDCARQEEEHRRGPPKGAKSDPNGRKAREVSNSLTVNCKTPYADAWKNKDKKERCWLLRFENIWLPKNGKVEPLDSRTRERVSRAVLRKIVEADGMADGTSGQDSTDGLGQFHALSTTV